MKHNTIETLVGMFVLIIAFSFLFFVYNTSSLSNPPEGYKLLANFDNIDGISKGADVKLAGIKIGIVDNITLENSTYSATLQLQIRPDVQVPDDSTATVATSGILDGRHIRINPGASDNNFTDGEKIKYTHSALNFEELIGKFMYSITSK